MIDTHTMSKDSKKRFFLNRKHMDDYPDRVQLLKEGKYTEKMQSFEQQINMGINQAKEERPAVLRSNVVDRYILDILGADKNPISYAKKLDVVKKMLFLRMDNRVLNSMRQVMNESIEDERGLMKVEQFVSMFDTAFKSTSEESKKTVKDMLLPLIKVDARSKANSIRTKSSKREV
jgi:hypothetical protein